MALVYADRVKVRSNFTGTGSATLDETVFAHQGFDAIGDGNETYYGIVDSAGNWEIGRGTYTAPNTLSRDTVLSSSNSNSLVDFPEGSKNIFVTFPAQLAGTIVSSGASDSFKAIAVSGQSNVVADSSTDTLTLVAGNNIDITTNATTDTITFNNDLSSVSQDIIPSIDSDGTTGYSLGSASYKWKELFVSTGSVYIGDIKLSNVGGKLSAKKVINPGEENEEDDPEDSDATSEISGGGGSVEVREINYPQGEEGDAQGTIVLTETGDTFICTADWVEAINTTGSTEIATNQDYNASQSGGTLVSWTTSLGDYPEIQTLFEAAGYVSGENWFYPNPEYFSVVSYDIFDAGKPRVCTGVGIDNNGDLYFHVAYTAGDPTSLLTGSTAVIIWTILPQQPAIWNQINFNSGSLTDFGYTDEESGYESTLNFTYDFYVDVENSHLNIDGDGSWEIGSNAFETLIRGTDYATQGEGDPLDVVITANENEWVFDRDGTITLPNTSKIVSNTGTQQGNILVVSTDDLGETPDLVDSGTLDLIPTATLEANDWIGANSMDAETYPTVTFADGTTEQIVGWNTDGNGSTGWLSLANNITKDGVDVWPFTVTSYDYVAGTTPSLDIDVNDNQWKFNTNGSITFPDGTTQTTAYTGSESAGEPLFIVVNQSGESAYSSDGETWTQVASFSDGGGSLSLDRVAVHRDFIVYIDGDDDLWVAEEPGVQPTLITITSEAEGSYNWNDVQVGGNYIVAVGRFNPAVGNDTPAFAYTTNGSSWTVGSVDPEYIAFTSATEFTSVDYDGTGWFITASDSETEGAGQGAFYTTDLTSELSEPQFITFTGLDAPPSIDSVTWTGSKWFVLDDDDSIVGQRIYVSSGADPLSSTWTQYSLSSIADDYDYRLGMSDNGFYVEAGGNGTFMIASGEGQILYTTDAGENWSGLVPNAYTCTIDSVLAGSSTVITGFTATLGGTNWDGNNFNGIEKLTITGATPSDYNGTRYVKTFGVPESHLSRPSNTLNTNWIPGTYNVVVGEDFTVELVVGEDFYLTGSNITIPGTGVYGWGHEFTISGTELGGTDVVDDIILTAYNFSSTGKEYRVFTDSACTTALDSSGFATFEGASAILNRGTFIDAAGYGLNKFLIGNDDEQLLTAPHDDLSIWTIVDNQANSFEYWDDIGFNAEFGSAVTSNITFSGNQIRGTRTSEYFGLIELVPNTATTGEFSNINFLNNGQYVRIYPTNEFDTPHIHIAAGTGSEQDGDLFIGDDNKFLQVNAEGYVVIGTYNSGTTNGYTWLFDNDGKLFFPGTSNATIGETDGGIELRSENGIFLTANTANAGEEKYFLVEVDGTVRLPGATYSTPAEPTPGLFSDPNNMALIVTAVDGLGAVTEITVANSPNAAWQADTYSGYSTGDINYTITVDGSGNATVSSITSGTGHSISESWNINGTDFGAPAYTQTTLDVTKQTQILGGVLNTSGGYILPDGLEGQIMYFVPAYGTSGPIYIEVANARVIDVGGSGLPMELTEYSWMPFSGETLYPTTIAMAIYADGAWCLRGGVSD